MDAYRYFSMINFKVVHCNVFNIIGRIVIVVVL